MDDPCPQVGKAGTLEVSEVHNPALAHERSDVNVRGIVTFAAGLFVIAVVVHVLVWWLFTYFAVRAERMQPPPAPLAASRPQLPPEPRLQTAPLRDLQEMRAAEEAILHSYGWVDRQAGVVRIPIERAMQLLAERNLPSRPHREDEAGKR